jgi:aminopeptidase-like protein
MKKDFSEYELLNSAFDALFPIMRSITGPGIEESIRYFSQYMPLTIEKVPTGEKVFDWTVPQEWHLKRARLWGPSGEIVCDTDIHTLHVVNYSEPVDKVLTLEQLEPHLHSLPHLEEAIPYVTSYYSKTWGFCLKEAERKKLQEGSYRVLIESEFIDGGVPFATCVLPGESEREILISSYLCHPSLANNELSGPLVMLALYRRLSSWKKRRYSYRFLLNPETIGSLSFLSRYHGHLRDNLEAGFIMTCMGGHAEKLRYKASRRGDTLLDQLMRRFSESREPTCRLPISYTDFCPLGGSDERQFCSPGFNFPVGQIARTVYGQYDGYHTSLDDKESMGIDSLIESVDEMEHILKLMEFSGNPVNQAPYGEPQLGKRGLYPNTNAHSTRDKSGDSQKDGRMQLNYMLHVLSLADGYTSTSTIADICKCSLDELRGAIDMLEEHDLIKFGAEPLEK